ncbi:MAG TPA: DUF2917 domain-containing protein [Burkholderiaceae bacterium]|nr:DUF2917 domain-containing protein [Burkholderiaceae bacterium]
MAAGDRESVAEPIRCCMRCTHANRSNRSFERRRERAQHQRIATHRKECQMMLNFESASFSLRADGEPLSLWNARGHRVIVRAGTIWLTQSGDRRDIVLEPGDAFAIERDGQTVMSTFDREAVVVIERRAPAAARSWQNAVLGSEDDVRGGAKLLARSV